MSVYRLRSSLVLGRMIVNNMDCGVVEQVEDQATKLLLKIIRIIRIFVQFRYPILKRISGSLSEDRRAP